MYMTSRVLVVAGITWGLLGSRVVQAQCETQKLTASDAATRDAFGNSVAISGNIAVVGAFNQGNTGNNLGFGKAYVFEIVGTTWTQVAELTPSDAEADKEFGNRVAIDGDTIVVGAGQDGGGIGVGTGAAYVFVKPFGGWVTMTETAKLTASDPVANDVFSTGLGISGGVVIIGAQNHDDAGSDSGAAYVFAKPTGGWVDMIETQKLLASDGTSGDRFGVGAAIDGNTVIIGADQINTGPGKAYVFELQSGTWVQTSILTPSDGSAGDRFGFAVAVRGGLAVVGAFRDDDVVANSGSAYVFVRPQTGWADMTQTSKLRALAPVTGDNLGISVSISVFDSVLVGAYAGENTNSTGSAFVFEKPGGGWVDMTETTKLIAFDSAMGDRFGSSVSIDTNVAIVGSVRDDDNGDRSGSAYILPCVGAQSDFQFECRIATIANGSDEVLALPDNVAVVGKLDDFVVELWATDSGSTNTGVVSAYTDLDYSEGSVTCEGATSSTLFNLFPDGICTGLIVDELGGSQLNPNIGVEPNWAKIATATFTADTIGPASFSLLPATTESSAHGRGTVLPTDINYGSCSVEIVCGCIYDLDDNCNVSGGDFGLFAPCWNVGDTDPEWTANNCRDKDFDLSGSVGGGDLGWFAGAWNTTCDLIDPIANYPAVRQCAAPIVCPLAAPASTPAAASLEVEKQAATSEDSVILSLRLEGLTRPDLRTSRLSISNATGVKEGERIRAEVWVNDTSATTNGLSVVYADLDFDPSRFEVVSIESGDSFTLFSDPFVTDSEGVVRQIGGATLDSGIAANSWVHVATVELEALMKVRSANISLRPSEGEAVSRYGKGLVSSDQIQVITRSTIKPDRIRKAQATR
jgi:FG-GAP repeat